MKALFTVILLALAMVVTVGAEVASGANANGDSDTFEWGAPSQSVLAHVG